jgi:hypothetical protein
MIDHPLLPSLLNGTIQQNLTDVMPSNAKHLGFPSRYEAEIIRLRLRMTARRNLLNLGDYLPLMRT